MPHSYPAPPSERSPYPDVASHIPVLYVTLTNVDFRYIYEFGAGDYSTKLLLAMARNVMDRRHLFTGENVAKWRPAPGPQHSVFTTYDIMPQSDSVADCVAFVDCESELRAPILRELFGGCNMGIAIAHDTEPVHDPAYGMARQLMRWPYGTIVRCPFTSVETTVVWRRENIELHRKLTVLSNDPQRHATAWTMAQLVCRMHGMEL